MGFRLRKRIKLFPGVSINLSRSGVSTSIGRPGAAINIGPRGTRGTVGIPGTGVSYSERLSAPTEPSDAPKGMGFGALPLWALGLFFVAMVLYAVFHGLTG